MKKNKCLGCSILMMVLIAGLMMISPITAKADYTYRINIVLGGTGEENAAFLSDLSSGLAVVSNGASVKISEDKNVITILGLDYNDEIIFNPKNSVAISTPEGDYTKYYVKGVRRSGADAVSTKSAFKVTQDDSYVIAYGVGSVIPYTVSYKDTDGNDLLATETFYAALGEEIYIPYRYISGYTPNAYNIHCGSVKENQAFVFTYTKGTATQGTQTINETRTEYENVGGGTTYTYVEGDPEYVYQTIPRPAEQGTINNRDAGGAGQAAGAGEGGAAEGAGDAGGQAGETIADEDTPLGVEDVIDITDEDVAKGVDDSLKAGDYKRYAIIAAVFGLFVFILALIATIKYTRKD